MGLQRSEKLSTPWARLHDTEASPAPGNADWIGASEGASRKGHAPARREIAEGKTAGQQNPGLEEALLKIAEIWQDVHTHRRDRSSKS
jgi:hypothetical protein